MNSESTSRERTFQFYWDLVMRRHLLLLGTFALVAAAIFGAGARERPLYRASATLIVSQDGAAQDPRYLFSPAAGGFAKRPVLVNHIEMLRSRTIAQMVYDALPADAQAQVRRETGGEPALWVQRSVSARPVRDADIIALAATAHDPALARALAEGYVGAYRTFNLNRSRADVSAIKEFIGGQLAVVGERLDSAERRLEAYKQTHRIADISEETRATVERQTQVLSLFEQTRAQREGVEQELAYVRARLDSAGQGQGFALDNAATPLVVGLRSELARMESERTGLLVSGYTESSARVRALGDRVAEMKDRIGSEMTRFVGAATGSADRVAELCERAAELGPERERLRASEAALAGVVENYDWELRSLPGRERSLARLERDVEAGRQVHMLLAQKHEEARIQEAGRISTVGVIDAPDAAIRVRPNHRNNAVAALLLALLLSFVTVVVVDYVDTTVRRPEDVERQGFSVLASVPRITDAVDATGPLAAREPGAVAVEAFRVLRTNLQFAAADKRLATVLVTSPGAGEGKSTVAANLATVLAQSGRRTLLVDADLRRPRQHKLFGGRKKPGLTDAVMLGCPLEQALSRIDADAGATDVAQGHSADMDVLFAGTTPPSPVDFLNSGTFGTFLERVAKDYDCVVVDTPPALVSADSAVLAARVDGVVLVSRMGKTDWRALAEARKLLIQAGARVLGVVANELVQRRGYGYYRYKYRYYHYRYGPAAAQ